MPTSILVLQRRQAGERAEELLDRLQSGVAADDRIRWSENGHVHLDSMQPLDEARLTLAGHLAEIDEDWAEHIQIL
jgi:hypothetical protein